MKKLLVSDYDGTLLKDPVCNMVAVEEFRHEGNLFAIATGRSYLDLLPSFQEYPFSYDYLILDHGAVIVNRKHELLLEQPLAETLLETLRSFFKERNLEDRVTFVTWNGEENRPIVKVMIACRSLEEVEVQTQELVEQFGSAIRFLSMPGKKSFLIELVDKQVDKKCAIDWICKKLTFPKDNVYVIGDGVSDASMIAAYGGARMMECAPCLKELTNLSYGRVADFVSELLK